MSHLDTREYRSRELKGGLRGHGHWLMVACCVPILVTALVLVATGVVGDEFALVAVICVAIMALMLRAMSTT